MALADLPVRVELRRGGHRGDVRPLDSAFAKLRLDRGQGWTVSQGGDSSFYYGLTLAGHHIMLNYLLQLTETELTGHLLALYIDRANRSAVQREARVWAAIEPCPGQ